MADQDKVSASPKKDPSPAKAETVSPAELDVKDKQPQFPFWYSWANSAALTGLALIAGLLAALLLWAVEAGSVVLLVGGFIAAFLAHGQARSWLIWPYPRAYVDQVREEQSKKGQHPESSVREIVDTIVFVIVLVLMLKSFVAEAFIIPTGSLASTLRGYHKEIECPSCGVVSPLNAHEEAEGQNGKRETVNSCFCQNCRRHIELDPKIDEPFEGPGTAPNRVITIRDPGYESGDRVIVAKFVYDVRPPNRLDVVVFKFPAGPQENFEQTNYIKRLIGLPGETIIIRGGNVYRVPADKNESFDDSDANPKDLWKPKYAHVRYSNPAGGERHAVNGLTAKEFFLKMLEEKRLEIIRKPPKVLLAMRRLVHDNNHPANDLKEFKDERGNPLFQRWVADRDNNGWEADGEHGFRHGGGGDAWLTYRHRLRQNGGKNSLITDFLTYNSFKPPRQPVGRNWVGDLILECKVEVEKAEGEFTLELSRQGSKFRARWNLATGECTLLEGDTPLTLPNGEPAVATTDLKKGSHHVRLANVDQRLTVWVDGELPFGDGVTYAPDLAEKGPTASDLQPARIGVKNAAVRVDDVSLWRDTYYTVINGRDGDKYASASGDLDPPDEMPKVISSTYWTNVDHAMKKKYAELPTCTMYVQPGHYLCLGDNSQQSSDSRTWGTVPQRLLLGRALSVYWPIGRFGRIW